MVLIAFAIGLIARTLVPGNDTYGSMLVPSVAAAAAAVIWVALTWAGLKYDGGWIWVASLVPSGILALALTLVIPRSRHRGDAAMLQQLSRA